MSDLVPILRVLTGIIIPLAVFFWLYQDDKDKRQTVLEIAKRLDDPRKVEQLLGIFDVREKEPVDYPRGGVITLFIDIGIYLLGMIVLGRFFEGIGLLVGAIGMGVMVAGYFFPNTSEEITNAIEK